MMRELIAGAMRHRDKAVCERGTYEEYAQAVLDAIRDAGFVVVPNWPTEAMVNAGDDEIEARLGRGGAEAVYKAMIEAAGGE